MAVVVQVRPGQGPAGAAQHQQDLVAACECCRCMSTRVPPTGPVLLCAHRPTSWCQPICPGATCARLPYCAVSNAHQVQLRVHPWGNLFPPRLMLLALLLPLPLLALHLPAPGHPAP